MHTEHVQPNGVQVPNTRRTRMEQHTLTRGRHGKTWLLVPTGHGRKTCRNRNPQNARQRSIKSTMRRDQVLRHDRPSPTGQEISRTRLWRQESMPHHDYTSWSQGFQNQRAFWQHNRIMWTEYTSWMPAHSHYAEHIPTKKLKN